MSETENIINPTDQNRALPPAPPEVEANIVPFPVKPTLTSIRLEGGFRALILETIHELGMLEKKRKRLMEEMESAAQSSAKLQKIDLGVYVLDVDSLEFVARPSAPPQETPTT